MVHRRERVVLLIFMDIKKLRVSCHLRLHPFNLLIHLLKFLHPILHIQHLLGLSLDFHLAYKERVSFMGLVRMG